MLHDPAAGELAFGLEIDRALFFQDFEGARPELQPQDVPFPREQVVIHIQPRHRLQMAPDDAVGDELCNGRRVVTAMFDVVKSGGANLQALLVFVVPLGDARVQIPAVVVEARRVGDLPDVVERLAFELAESEDDVGDLNTGVVDVVLHLDRNAAESLDAHERVAERGIPEVPDVRGLVGIDGCVLDDRLGSSIGHRRSAIVDR